MNYNIMTDTELLHYLDLYSNDPLIRRVIQVIERTREILVDDLVDAGMDPVTLKFKDNWESMSPGSYIEDLRVNLRNAEADLSDLQYKHENIQDQYDQLKTKNIMQFIEEVQEERKANQGLVKEAMSTVKAFKDENDKLREQIDMWGKLNHVKQGV